MMIRSLQEVDTLMSTIRRVDKEISRRRLEIKNNIVPNAGLARQQVEALVRDNNRRKAYLRVNSGHIEALRASGARFTPLRTSFITPDGPKHKGNKRDSKRKQRARENWRKTLDPRKKSYAVIDGKYYFEGKQVSKAQYKKLMEPIRQRNITKKQRKKTQGPKVELDMSPPPVKETVALPRQNMQQAADSIRQQNTILAKQREQVIRKQRDAQRDAELVKQGQAKVVAQRRAREAAEAKAKAKAEAKRRRDQAAAAAKKAAAEAEKNARAAASRVSQAKLPPQVISRGRAVFNTNSRPRVDPTGILPQMVMVTALNDKKRSQTVNNAVRSPSSSAPQTVIKDQITEDIRKPVSRPNQRSKEFMAFMKQFSEMVNMAHKEINLARQGQGMYGDYAKILGKEKANYFANKAMGLLNQVKQMVANEATRWDQGALNAGVSVSTDTRSQSSRKMTVEEFGTYIQAKIEPMMESFMKELMEEVMRAQTAKGAQLGHAYHKVALGNSLPVSRQRSLASADKLRGHGRPVLSEQQGTQGLAGLFPALRSSMQGVLRQ